MSSYWKVTLFSNQRDPVRRPWKAKTRLAAFELVADMVIPECLEREKAGEFFVGEEVRIRVELIQG
jgi:hypothetical protein